MNNGGAGRGRRAPALNCLKTGRSAAFPSNALRSVFRTGLQFQTALGAVSSATRILGYFSA
jgi:hypothetical protein